MKKIISIAFVCLVVISFASKADALTIGSFDSSRINYSGGVFETGLYSTIREQLLIRGDTIQTINTLTSGSLSGVDVFYTSLLQSFTDSGNLSSLEQTALVNWVFNGGTLFSAGDTLGFQNPYNTFLNPFGITISGTSNPSVGTHTVVDFTSPITNGPNGTVNTFDVNTSGIFDTGSYNILATDLVGATTLLQLSFGLGQIIAIGDHNLFTDANIGINERTLFLNILDSTPVVSAVPVPAAAWLFGSAVLGFFGMRRKSAKVSTLTA